MPGATALPFHVLGSAVPMPVAERVVYVDGSAPPSSFRPGVDLELSHWVPTTTPARWAADTSTETALRFLADPPDDADEYGLVVNNHVDVDGILSVFVLAHPDVALAHRDVLVGAAESGDLSAWAEWPAFRLAQELTVLMGGFGGAGRDPLDVYREAFTLVPAILADAHPAPDVVQRGWEILQAEVGAMGRGGLVEVEDVGPRLALFVQVEVSDRRSWEAQLRVPGFNPLIDDSVWLWPHVRNRTHPEALHLVATSAGGCAYDLWLPGYVWAHTPDRWRPPLIEGPTSANTWRVRTELLADALEGLRSAERRRRCRWAVADEVDPFSALPGRGFPVVLASVDDAGRPRTSSLPPDEAVAHLAPALAGGPS